MADISKIVLPGSTTEYDIKDKSALSGASVDGTTITLTKRDGTSSTITTQDTVNLFCITEDMVTVEQDATKGVAPYSTSYGHTNITIVPDAGVEWVEGGIYSFVVNTKLVVASAYRNVRVRIGTDGAWKPCMDTSAIIAGSSYFVKALNTLWQYKSSYQAGGALHKLTDNNSTYAYLVNTIYGNADGSPSRIDDNGYGARYTYAFATTPLSDANGIVTDERWSSLVKSSSTGTTKVAVTPKGGKFYIDRPPQYIVSANVAAGAKPVASLYQSYTGMDMRYTVNTSTTYISTFQKCFLHLKNFDPDDMSFEADASIGEIMSLDKISTKFPSTVTGHVYLYFLGWNTNTWYSLTPLHDGTPDIYRYTPSTGLMISIRDPRYLAEVAKDMNNVLYTNEEMIYCAAYLQSSGAWQVGTNYDSVLVPAIGKTITVKASTAQPVHMAFLKDAIQNPVNGSNASLSAGTSRTTVAVGTTSKMDIPSDCKYICFCKMYKTENHMPIAVYHSQPATIYTTKMGYDAMSSHDPRTVYVIMG